MVNILKIKSKNEEREKYSFISVEDLEKLKVRALQLSVEMKSIDVVSKPKEYKVRLEEYLKIVSDLRKYKKYAKN